MYQVNVLKFQNFVLVYDNFGNFVGGGGGGNDEYYVFDFFILFWEQKMNYCYCI